MRFTPSNHVNPAVIVGNTAQRLAPFFGAGRKHRDHERFIRLERPEWANFPCAIPEAFLAVRVASLREAPTWKSILAPGWNFSVLVRLSSALPARFILSS
jgi:hypothetical protein